MIYDLEFVDHDNLVKIPATVYPPPYIHELPDGVVALSAGLFGGYVAKPLPSDAGDQYTIWSAMGPVALDRIDLPRL